MKPKLDFRENTVSDLKKKKSFKKYGEKFYFYLYYLHFIYSELNATGKNFPLIILLAFVSSIENGFYQQIALTHFVIK